MDNELKQELLSSVAQLYAADQFKEIIIKLEEHLSHLDYDLALELARAYINEANTLGDKGDELYAQANALLDHFTLDGKDHATYLFYKGYALFKLGLVNDAALRFERALKFIKMGKEDQLLGHLHRMMELCRSFDPDRQDISLSAADAAILDAHIKEFYGQYRILFKTDRYELLNILPTEEHPYNLIMTRGLSGKQLNVPAGVDPFTDSRLELCLCLPKEWEFSNSEGYNIWPVNVLCEFINFILTTDEFVGFGYTFTQTKPFHETTEFNSAMLTALGYYPRRGQEVALSDNSIVHFFELVFLYPMELAFRKTHNVMELLDLFRMKQINPSPVRKRSDVCMQLNMRTTAAAEKI